MNELNAPSVRVPAPGSKMAIWGATVGHILAAILVFLPRNPGPIPGGTFYFIGLLVLCFLNSMKEFKSAETLYEKNKDILLPPYPIALKFLKIAPISIVLAIIFSFYPLFRWPQ